MRKLYRWEGNYGAEASRRHTGLQVKYQRLFSYENEGQKHLTEFRKQSLSPTDWSVVKISQIGGRDRWDGSHLSCFEMRAGSAHSKRAIY